MKFAGVFIIFIMMMILAYFAVGVSSSVAAPNSTTAAGQQYDNLSKAVSIANTGMYGTFLIVMGIMVFSALGVLIFSIKKR